MSGEQTPAPKESLEDPDLPKDVREWNKLWRVWLRHFNYLRMQPKSLEGCVALLPELQNEPNIPDHVQEPIHLMSQHFTVDITSRALRDLCRKGGNEGAQLYERIVREVDSCCENITASATHVLIADKIQAFVQMLKTYLACLRLRTDTEATAQCLFQAFANLVKLPFQPGNIQKAQTDIFRKRLDLEETVLVSSTPDLRVTVANEADMSERLLCLAHVDKQRFEEEMLPAGDIHGALYMSEKYIGQLLGEALVERKSSVFSNLHKTQVLAFGVRGTQVQMFVFDNCEHHVTGFMNDNDGIGIDPDPSELYTSTSYDILSKFDRTRLLQAMAKLACYQL